MAIPTKLAPKALAVLGALTILVPLTAVAGKAQAAETFSVNGNKALNTNYGFRKIDGEPRMSIFQRNDSDPDQQFDRLGGNLGGTLLKHRTTGKCLNAHYLFNGAEINVWGCNGSDPDQNWDMLPQGNGINLIRRRGTNLCVDSPTRTDTGKVHLWTCDATNANQRFQSSAINPRITLSDLQRLLFGNAPNSVTSPYGYVRCDIWSKFYTGCAHPALDIASSWTNAPIYTPVSGEVIQTDPNTGKVALYNAQANVTFFFYHMNTVNVRQGTLISKGTQVGTQGTRGYVTGAHLHFETRIGRTVYMANSIGQTIDPVDGVNRVK